MEVRQVLVVGKDLDGERRSMEVVPPRLQDADDSKELSVVDVIVALYRDKRLGEVRAGMPVTIGIGLEKDSARGVLRSVGGDGERLGKVWEMEDGAREKEFLKLVEGLLTGGGPIPMIVFLCKVKEEAGNGGVVGNESVVEVGKAKK